jgi:LytS/YehU family sensor histidine kinase
VGFPGPGGEIPLPLPVPEHGGGRHNHIALNSVMRLLQHFYGPGYGLAIVSFPGRGTTVTMTIPREEAAHDEGDDRG